MKEYVELVVSVAERNRRSVALIPS